MFVAAIVYLPTSHLNHILFNTDISMSDNKIAVSLFWTKVNKIAVSLFCTTTLLIAYHDHCHDHRTEVKNGERKR